MRKLMLAAALSCAPTLSLADTVTVGYFDPAAGMPGIQILGTASGVNPVVSLVANPILPTGVTGFGFDQILAAVIPPGGNNISGGVPGATFNTLEFTFNDGFAPPQGGTAYLFASFTGTFTGTGTITMPTVWGSIESPPSNPGFTLTTQVLTCATNNPFCGPFVGGTSVFNGQDQFSNQLRLDNTTLTTFLPGQEYKITELFVFQGGPHPPFAQGDVGGVIETTLQAPTPVPVPAVGSGLPGILALVGWLLYRRKRRVAAA